MSTYYLERANAQNTGQVLCVFFANEVQALDIPAFTIVPANPVLIDCYGIFATIDRWQKLICDNPQLIIPRAFWHVQNRIR